MIPSADSMRLDRFLWWARLAKTRSAAQALAGTGHLRLDGRPIDRAHAAVRVGAILTFAQGSRIRVVRVEALTQEDRRRLRVAGITLGALDLFDPRLLKPEPARWRRVLLGLRDAAPPEPPIGATVLPRGHAAATLAAGFRPLGVQTVRVDLVERIARAAHDARQGRKPFAPDPALATSMGLEPATFERLMAELGFRPAGGEGGWVWRGRPPARPTMPTPSSANAFASLAEMFAR